MYQPSFLQPMYQILCGGLRDGDAQVRLSAFQCIAQFITALEALMLARRFKRLSRSFCAFWQRSFLGDEAQEGVSRVPVSVAESQSCFGKPHPPEGRQAMHRKQTQALDDGSRTTAMEFILALCESRPTMVRKRGDLLEHLLDTCFPALCEVEEMDTESWASAPENDDTYGDVEDTDAFCNAIEQAFDRLATAIGGQTMSPMLLPRCRAFVEGQGADGSRGRSSKAWLTQDAKTNICHFWSNLFSLSFLDSRMRTSAYALQPFTA